MIVNRRTFSAMLAGTVLAPQASFAQTGKERVALYSGVGTDLTHFEVDAEAVTLTRRGTAKVTGGVQYVWPHPSRKYLYVSSSTGGPGFTGNEHRLAAFTVGPTGELTPFGDVVALRSRPIHTSVDVDGAYVLVAYNFPAGVERPPHQRRWQPWRGGASARQS